MKTQVIPGRKRVLYSVADVAREVGDIYQSLWYDIQKGYVPRPTVASGRSKYYTEDAFRGVCELVKARLASR